MTDTDRADLTAWLDANPEHRWVLSRYRQLSAEVEERLGSLLATAADSEAGARRRRRFTGFAVAAAATIALLATIWNRGSDEFTTRPAERHVASLTDGSRVELNAQTDLEIDFDRRERRVRLVRGEAFFDVAKETARPFVVATPGGIVRVTGTAFNVRATQLDGVEVTVLEGRVRVQPATDPSAETALELGQQAVVEKARFEVKNLAADAVQNVVAWREGQAVFEDTPLAAAMERFAVYHGRRIAVDSRIADLRLGGRHRLDDLEGLLDEIERVLPVRVLRQSGNVVRLVPAEKS